ncbi:MAG TPA: SMI1/KNR4 family protein [Planctomycetota bacterium]|nr:SMI1/KNR4 family protein [Planctomycetota bacterium]
MSASSIDDVMRRMREKGFRAGTPSTEIQVRRLEKEFGSRLPDDYRSFLLAFGGGESGAFEAWRGLWRIADLWTLNSRYHVQENFPGLLAIGNQAFMLYALDLRGEAAPLVSLGLSSSLWEDVLLEADSFTEWLDAIVPG